MPAPRRRLQLRRRWSFEVLWRLPRPVMICSRGRSVHSAQNGALEEHARESGGAVLGGVSGGSWRWQRQRPPPNFTLLSRPSCFPSSPAVRNPQHAERREGAARCVAAAAATPLITRHRPCPPLPGELQQQCLQQLTLHPRPPPAGLIRDLLQAPAHRQRALIERHYTPDCRMTHALVRSLPPPGGVQPLLLLPGMPDTCCSVATAAQPADSPAVPAPAAPTLEQLHPATAQLLHNCAASRCWQRTGRRSSASSRPGALPTAASTWK